MPPKTLIALLCVPVVFALTVVVATSPTVCTGVANDSPYKWWLSPNNQSNPCEVLELLLQECDADFNLPSLGPSVRDEVCSPAPDTQYANVSLCCCSTEAYALFNACWTCQNGGNPYPANKRPTLREFIQCPATLEDDQDREDAYAFVDVPYWASIGINLDVPWDFNDTRGAQMAHDEKSFAKGDDDDGDDDDINTTTKHVIIASVVGSVCGLAFVSCLLAIAFAVRRRRRRQHGARIPQSSAKNGLPAWFTPSGSSGYVSIDSDPTYVDSGDGVNDAPPMPRPTLGRGRFTSLIGAGSSRSWRSSLAKEPYLPRAGNTLESRDFARSTVSMIRSETTGSRLSLESEATIESFSNSRYRPPTVASQATHAFSV